MRIFRISGVPSVLYGIRPACVIVCFQGFEDGVALALHQKVTKILVTPADERVLSEAIVLRHHLLPVVLLSRFAVFQSAPFRF